MRTFIPIDRDSIRRNKRAGQTVTSFHGRTTGEIHIAFVGPSRVDLDDGIDFANEILRGQGHTPVRMGIDRNECAYVEAVTDVTRDLRADFEAIEKALGGRGLTVARHRCKLEMNTERNTVRHLPIPQFEYSYVPTPVKCDECGASFLHTALLSEESDDGECYSARVCPVCKAFECCDLEFEKLTQDMTAGVGVEAEA